MRGCPSTRSRGRRYEAPGQGGLPYPQSPCSGCFALRPPGPARASARFRRLRSLCQGDGSGCASPAPAALPSQELNGPGSADAEVEAEAQAQSGSRSPEGPLPQALVEAARPTRLGGSVGQPSALGLAQVMTSGFWDGGRAGSALRCESESARGPLPPLCPSPCTRTLPNK